MDKISMRGVVVAAVACFFVGGFWYSPLLFGNVYLELRGIDPAAASAMPLGEIIAEFSRCLVVAATFAYLIARLGVSAIGGALKLAGIVAIGFQLMGQIGGTLHEAYPASLQAIHFGDHLVKAMVAATILTVFQRGSMRPAQTVTI